MIFRADAPDNMKESAKYLALRHWHS